MLGAGLGLGPSTYGQCAEWAPGFHAGAPGPTSTVRCLATYDDGSGPALFVGGDFLAADGVSASYVAKWDGVAWSAVGAPGSGLNGSVQAMVVHDDGSGPALYAGGAFTTAGGAAASRIARWDGSSWSALGSPTNGVDNIVYCLATHDDGTGAALFAGGAFSNAGGMPASRIAKWNGTSWSALGTPSNGVGGVVRALGEFDDGTGAALYVGGDFTTAGGASANRIAKWDGTSWSALGGAVNGTNGGVYALKAFDDGGGPGLFVGGNFGSAGGVTANKIAKWDGSAWSALPGSPIAGGLVWSLGAFDLGSGTTLYAGGDIGIIGQSGTNVFRWTGTAWSALGSGVNDTVLCLGAIDDGSGPGLFAGGELTTAGGNSASRIARWDQTSWTAVGTVGDGLDQAVFDLEAFDDGSGPALLAGGSFASAGGVSAPAIAKWDGSAWSPLDSPGTGPTNGTIRSLAIFDDGSGDALYAGGGFLLPGGIFPSKVARWNGSTWSELVGGVNLTDAWALTAFDDGTGPALYVAGQVQVNGVWANIARWSGAAWTPLGTAGAFGNAILALAVFDDGSGPALYAGGQFTSASGTPANHVARWDGTSWSALGSPTNGVNDWVYCLTVFDDGSGAALYAGGRFTSAGGQAANRIAKWNGTNWSALGAGLGGTLATVRAIAGFDDGSGPALHVAGEFSTAGGLPAQRIAKWNGTSWSALGAPDQGPNELAMALAVFDDGDDGDSDLYVGGFFTTIGPLQSWRIAKWHGCASEPVALCFADGSGSVCPCGNLGLPGRGCDNSAGTGGAELTASGTVSPDTLVLSQDGELASSLSIFLQGTIQLANPVVFGDGLRCTGGALKRLYVKAASAGSVSAPQAGDPSITTQSAALGDPLAPGATRFYQVYYRDPDLTYCPAPPGDAFNVGNALRIVW